MKRKAEGNIQKKGKTPRGRHRAGKTKRGETLGLEVIYGRHIGRIGGRETKGEKRVEEIAGRVGDRRMDRRRRQRDR